MRGVAKRRFEVIYDPEVRDHLRAIERKYHGLIRESIEEQLFHVPDVETRNRKPLTRPSVWEDVWELRLGPNNRFRVFYRIDPARREVHVFAIGVKRGHRLVIGRKEIEL
jgi:mRNA-degrading endonuclease RelE of RelBE toxin-antitoxin system